MILHEEGFHQEFGTEHAHHRTFALIWDPLGIVKNAGIGFTTVNNEQAAAKCRTVWGVVRCDISKNLKFYRTVWLCQNKIWFRLL